MNRGEPVTVQRREFWIKVNGRRLAPDRPLEHVDDVLRIFEAYALMPKTRVEVACTITEVTDGHAPG